MSDTVILIRSSLRRCIDYVKELIENIIYNLIPIEQNTYFFYPHPNVKADNYNLINYHSDNVLCLVNYLLRNYKNTSWKFVVVTYESDKNRIIQEYCNNINPNIRIKFVYYKNRFDMLYWGAKSQKIFVATVAPGCLFYRKNKQTVVDLGYFIPFKDNYIKDVEKRKRTLRKNKLLSYFLMSADLPARIFSHAFNIPYEKALLLGFCRNDIFYKAAIPVKEILSEELSVKIEHILVYTPTWRDYEIDNGNSLVQNKSLFGYGNEGVEELEKILEFHNAIIVAKLHPLQSDLKLDDHFNHIIPYACIKKCNIDLYELLNASEGLITDYTSTYFDYLHKNKPVIFNFYDIIDYKKYRGFSYEPIDYFCAGDIVFDSNSLNDAIKKVLQGIDAHKNKREEIRTLFDKYCDGRNTERIANYFFAKQ